MDEITLFTAIKPSPPENGEVIRRGARARLAAVMTRPQRTGRYRWPGPHHPNGGPVRYGPDWRRSLMLAAGTAAACAAITAALVAMTGGAAPSTSTGGAQARTTAYVIKRVENALAGTGLVFHGRTSSDVGPSSTWVYGSRNRFEEYSPNCGHLKPNGECTGHGGSVPFLAEGTAFIGGQLTGVYVTYFDHRWSRERLYPATGACSTTDRLGMGGPPPVTGQWQAFIQTTLACGAATVTGHVRVDGVETTKITGLPVTVRLSRGMAGSVGEKWARVRWALYVNPTTYLPVRTYGSTQTFGGPEPSFLSWSVTDVQWLPPTAANIAKALVTIPHGYRQVSSAADQQPG
jgi:hypothetical protein